MRCFGFIYYFSVFRRLCRTADQALTKSCISGSGNIRPEYLEQVGCNRYRLQDWTDNYYCCKPESERVADNCLQDTEQVHKRPVQQLLWACLLLVSERQQLRGNPRRVRSRCLWKCLFLQARAHIQDVQKAPIADRYS